ncbi:MAG: DUF4340 domain-containing protein [Treponema sp.]|jgi:hypothetical protein|nr:DUF4340 domain-containing protein [Treponema sp.]
MSKNSKILIISGIVLLLLAGGYAIVLNLKKASPQASQTAFPESIKLISLEQDTIARIEVPGTSLILEKREDAWEVPDTSFAIDQGAVSNALWSLSNLYAEKIVEEVPESLVDYGLDTPQAHIILTAKDGERVELYAGNKSPSLSSMYVMKAGDPKVYLVSSYSGERIGLNLADIRNKNLFPAYENADVVRFRLRKGDSRIEIHQDTAAPQRALAANLYTSVLEGPYIKPIFVETEKYYGLLDAFKNLAVIDFVEDTPVSLEPYGLDQPYEVYIQTNDIELNMLAGNSAGGKTYVQLNGDRAVYTIKDIASSLQTKPFDLINKFALLINIDTVNTLDFRGEGMTVNAEIKRRGEGDEKEEWYFINGKRAVEKNFKALYQAVIGLMIDAEAPDRPIVAAAPGEIFVEYRLNVPGMPRARIELMPYDRDFYALNDGGTVEFLVSRPQINGIRKALDNMAYEE